MSGFEFVEVADPLLAAWNKRTGDAQSVCCFPLEDPKMGVCFLGNPQNGGVPFGSR